MNYLDRAFKNEMEPIKWFSTITRKEEKNMYNVEVDVVVEDGGFMPEQAYITDAGFDIRTPEEVTVKAKSSVLIDTLVRFCVPEGYYAKLESKSGLNCKNDIVTTGTIDANYTGTVKVKVHNLGDEDYVFLKGDKISQLVVNVSPQVKLNVKNALNNKENERGENGFGSSGR